jgi:cold shock CspA family protein
LTNNSARSTNPLIDQEEFLTKQEITMAETWNKKERERKKREKKKEKMEKRLERKQNNNGSHNLDDMLAYVDENGSLSSRPPDPKKKITINIEDIDISIPRHKEIDPADLIRVGIVTFFNHDKGYGFIKDQKTHESVFVHVTSLAEAVKENNKVSFEIEKGPKGTNATNVRLVR